MIQRRLQARRGHFMHPGLLASQIAALEPPDHCIACDIARAPNAVVDHILERLRQS
jgi:gluconate kinase